MSRIHLKLFSLLRSLSWEQIIKIGNFVNLWDDAGSGHMLLVIDEIELKIFHKHVNEQSISGWSFDTNLIHQTLKKKVSEKLYLKLKRERINYFQHFALTSLNWDSFDTHKKITDLFLVRYQYSIDRKCELDFDFELAWWRCRYSAEQALQRQGLWDHMSHLHSGLTQANTMRKRFNKKKKKKHRKNCECCPVSLLIVRKQSLSRNQVLNCQKCNQCLKGGNSFGMFFEGVFQLSWSLSF